MPRFVPKPKKPAGRGRLYVNARKTVLARSQVCWICIGECPDFKWDKLPFDSAAIDMSLKWPDPGSASVDHVIPISMLAADDPRMWSLANLKPAHLKCNSARGNGVINRKQKAPVRVSRNWLA